ncbi:hypothetical protein Tco_0773851 [Tanacetum coccineum]|uniref:Transposase n=1 Tax=Tanacetum coccineum TaxID=301880 RepID=A0ABQ4ZLY4_9ASTR
MRGDRGFLNDERRNLKIQWPKKPVGFDKTKAFWNIKLSTWRGNFARECRHQRIQVGNRKWRCSRKNWFEGPTDLLYWSHFLKVHHSSSSSAYELFMRKSSAILIDDSLDPPPYTGTTCPQDWDLSFAGFDDSVLDIMSGNIPVNTAKQSSSRAAVSNSTARYVNTAASRPTVNGAKPSSNVFHKSHSSVKRTIYQRTTPKNSDFKEKVNTAKVNNITTGGTKAVVSAVQGHEENVVKSSACWIWRPTGKVIDHISKDSGSYMPKRFDYVDPQGRLKIFDSGCSRHMTGNKFYLSDYQDIDGEFVAFAGSPK